MKKVTIKNFIRDIFLTAAQILSNGAYGHAFSAKTPI